MALIRAGLAESPTGALAIDQSVSPGFTTCTRRGPSRRSADRGPDFDCGLVASSRRHGDGGGRIRRRHHRRLPGRYFDGWLRLRRGRGHRHFAQRWLIPIRLRRPAALACVLVFLLGRRGSGLRRRRWGRLGCRGRLGRGGSRCRWLGWRRDLNGCWLRLFEHRRRAGGRGLGRRRGHRGRRLRRCRRQFRRRRWRSGDGLDLWRLHRDRWRRR